MGADKLEFKTTTENLKSAVENVLYKDDAKDASDIPDVKLEIESVVPKAKLIDRPSIIGKEYKYKNLTVFKRRL